MKQISFASLTYETKKKQTKREKLFAEMESVVSWSRLLSLIESYYSKAGKGRKSMPLEVMLRILFCSNDMADQIPAMKNQYRIDASFRRSGIR